MLTEIKNKGTMSAHDTSTPTTSSAPPALPSGREHEKSVLVHSAWAGWHYEISSDEEGAGF
ncbi:hypothetical protein [Paenarthrobacter sp.]|uniref:hypothetical protein n=1 Tax=Paenarthrobacter sp. TaxID=1931993 RepID=UPI0028117017|nr:hypothetical protein [Paenarthrobacter sp.]